MLCQNPLPGLKSMQGKKTKGGVTKNHKLGLLESEYATMEKNKSKKEFVGFR